MYVENMKLGLIALGVVLLLLFIVGILMFWSLHYLIQYATSILRKE